MKRGPAFLDRIPDIVASLKDPTVVHEQLDAELLKRCLSMGATEAGRVMDELRRRLGLGPHRPVPKAALLELLGRRIDESSSRLERTLDAKALGSALGIGPSGAAQVLRACGVRVGASGWAVTPTALRRTLAEAFTEQLEVLSVGDVARIIGISRRAARYLVGEAGGSLRGNSLTVFRVAFLRHLVRLYNHHGGHEAFGEIREILDGRISGRVEIPDEPSARRGRLTNVEPAEGSITFRVTSVAQLLQEVRQLGKVLQDPAARRRLDATLGGLV